MSRKPTVTISRPGEGRAYDVLGARVAVHSPRGAIMLADHPLPVGYQVPMHVHHDEDEAAYVLEGTITFFTPEGEHPVEAGGFVSLPRGAAHGFANRGKVEARMLVISSAGGGLEGVFDGLDEHARKGTLAPPTIGATLAENGLQLLPA